jgi:hypothetical protein
LTLRHGLTLDVQAVGPALQSLVWPPSTRTAGRSDRDVEELLWRIEERRCAQVKSVEEVVSGSVASRKRVRRERGSNVVELGDEGPKPRMAR